MNCGQPVHRALAIRLVRALDRFAPRMGSTGSLKLLWHVAAGKVRVCREASESVISPPMRVLLGAQLIISMLLPVCNSLKLVGLCSHPFGVTPISSTLFRHCDEPVSGGAHLLAALLSVEGLQKPRSLNNFTPFHDFRMTRDALARYMLLSRWTPSSKFQRGVKTTKKGEKYVDQCLD